MQTAQHAAALALVALCCISAVAGQTKPACDSTTNGQWYQENGDVCTPKYEVCRSFSWRFAHCVVGHFNSTTGRCQVFSEGGPCQNNDVAKYAPIFASVANTPSSDCTEFYTCPNNVNQPFAFPHWSNTFCKEYMICYQGQVRKVDCQTNSPRGTVSQEQYYNPRLMSCEAYPALSNTCVWRDWASYAPFQGTI